MVSFHISPLKMPLPISREVMLQLKRNKDEESRRKRVEVLVNGIYSNALRQAETSDDKQYYYKVPSSTESFPEEVVEALKELFPGCSVSHTLLASGSDGKMYDISKIDENILPLINKALDDSYIVVDWS